MITLTGQHTRNPKNEKDMEEWKSIKEFENLYEVSNYGNVKSLEKKVQNHSRLQLRKERILKPHYNKLGYGIVVLCKEGKTYPRLLHRLVAEAFIPNPENKPYVDHIDTNPQNNNVENLKWVTPKENSLNPLTRKHNSDSKKGHKSYFKCHTEQSKRKMSEKRKGIVFSEEHRKNLSISHKGIMLSEETKRKISETNKGHPVSEETRNKIHVAHLKRRSKI